MARPPGLIPKISGPNDLHGVCWWCGGVADSTEHRHKKTDLKRFGTGALAPVWQSEDYPTPQVIRSPSSKSWTVRFGKVLCRTCNGTRSQPFDRAYERFSDALVAGMDGWWRSAGFDMEGLYGESWEEDALNLARYYVKNFGCQLADGNVPPPRTMVDFLDGADHMEDVSLCLVKSGPHHIAHKQLRKHGPNASLWRTPTDAYTRGANGPIVGIVETVLIGYVGVRFEWHEGWGRRDCFFHYPHPVLNKISTPPALHARLVRDGARLAWALLTQRLSV